MTHSMAITKLKMGMVGGGQGAFIGAVHRIAAQLDNQIELVCGAFNQNPDDAIASGLSFGLPKSRCYGSYKEMFIEEQKLPDTERMDLVAIVTPNHLHYDIAKLAIEHGFHVISDKPATLNLNQAIALSETIAKHNSLYALTHTYSGYPMVKEAKHRIKQHELGEIRKVVVNYPQGWLSQPTDETNKQAAWRLNPEMAGISCCIADIGVHGAHLAEYISGLTISHVCADLTTTVAGRYLDDDGTVMLRFSNGAKGVLLASQIATGEENNLTISLYGEKASLHWSQESPNSLIKKYPNQSSEIIRTGVGNLCAITQSNTRLPAGHPEGYIEAFANIYLNFAQQIHALKHQLVPPTSALDVPDIEDAIRGMTFIERVVQASESDKKWHKI